MLLQILLDAKLEDPMPRIVAPEKRIEKKQLLADEKFIRCYHTFEYPCLITFLRLYHSLPLFLDDAQMTNQTFVRICL